MIGFRSTEQFKGDGRSVPIEPLDLARNVWIEYTLVALVGSTDPVAIDCRTAAAARIAKSEEKLVDKILLRGIAMDAEVIPGTVEVDLVWLDADAGVRGGVLVS